MFQLEPVGRHVVEVCTNISCALVGAQQVLEAFERELGVHAGETTAGRRGHAAHGRVRRRLRLGDGRRGRPPLPRAGSRRRRPGDRQGAARCRLGSSCSRTRTPRPDPALRVRGRRRLRLAAQGARDGAQGRARRAARGRACAAAAAPASRWAARRASSPSRRRRRSRSTSSSTRTSPSPGTFKDREIMLRVPHLFVEGVITAAYAIGANLAFIYLRGEYLTEYEVVVAALEEARKAGYVGPDVLGSGWNLAVVIHRGAGAYICGEETGAARVARGQARPAAHEAAVPGHLRPLRLADADQQRRDARDRAEDPRDGRQGVRAARRRELGRHARLLALGQRRQRRELRARAGDDAARADLRHRRRHPGRAAS